MAVRLLSLVLGLSLAAVEAAEAANSSAAKSANHSVSERAEQAEQEEQAEQAEKQTEQPQQGWQHFADRYAHDYTQYIPGAGSHGRSASNQTAQSHKAKRGFETYLQEYLPPGDEEQYSSSWTGHWSNMTAPMEELYSNGSGGYNQYVKRYSSMAGKHPSAPGSWQTKMAEQKGAYGDAVGSHVPFNADTHFQSKDEKKKELKDEKKHFQSGGATAAVMLAAVPNASASLQTQRSQEEQRLRQEQQHEEQRLQREASQEHARLVEERHQQSRRQRDEEQRLRAERAEEERRVQQELNDEKKRRHTERVEEEQRLQQELKEEKKQREAENQHEQAAVPQANSSKQAEEEQLSAEGQQQEQLLKDGSISKCFAGVVGCSLLVAVAAAGRRLQSDCVGPAPDELGFQPLLDA